jgi:hypothetical protein
MILFRIIPKPEFAEAVLIKLKLSIFSCVLKFNLPYMLWFLSGILLIKFIWVFNYKVLYKFAVGKQPIRAILFCDRNIKGHPAQNKIFAWRTSCRTGF